MPNGRCYLHGGKSLSGAAAPAFKTGRYSKYLPERLAQRYHEAQADNDLLVLRDEIALLDARLGELLGRIDTGESAQRWAGAREAFVTLQQAKDSGDDKKAATAMSALGSILLNNNDYGIWEDIAALLDLRKRMVESERKRLVEMQQMITAERAMILMAAIVDTIRTHVTDRNALAAISSDLRKLITLEPSG